MELKTIVNSLGEKGILIKYHKKGSYDIVVNDKYLIPRCQLSNFKKGSYANYNLPTVLGHGVLGYGEFKPKTHPGAYTCWMGMLRRVYNEADLIRRPSYRSVKICSEWHYFQTFAKWYYENIYEFSEMIALDKDLMCKNSKIYSPSTCCFLPMSINSLILKSDKTRGDCVIGVYYYKEYDKYSVMHRMAGNKRKFVGYFEYETDAFKAYKASKEEYIKQVAANFEKSIPKRVYNAIVNYKIDIND